MDDIDVIAGWIEKAPLRVVHLWKDGKWKIRGTNPNGTLFRCESESLRKVIGDAAFLIKPEQQQPTGGEEA